MVWNFDIGTAPVSGPVILASKCGKVIKSRWLEEPGRWEFFKSGEQPVAWFGWPEHPAATAVEGAR